MKERLTKYLDGLFSPYEDLNTIKELKEELHCNLQEKYNDLISQGLHLYRARITFKWGEGSRGIFQKCKVERIICKELRWQ